MADREFGKVLTANRRRDGAVVFLTRKGVWSDSIHESVVALEPQSQAALARRAKAAECSKLVARAYLVDVERCESRIRTLNICDRVLLLGSVSAGDASDRPHA